MLTTTSSFNSVTMAQIETLFAALPARHGKLAHKPEVKPSSRPDAAQASPARNVAGETLQAIQALISQVSGALSQSPVSPAAAYSSQSGTLGFSDTGATEATIEGSLGDSSYSFSFSANQRMDSGSDRPTATSYSFCLSVDGHFVMSGWVDGGRDPSTDPVQIKLGFSYAETAYTATSGGSQPAVQALAVSTVAGQITIDAGALARSVPLSYGEYSRGQQFETMDLGQDLRISSSVMMACGEVGSVSFSQPGGSICSGTAENWSSLVSSLQVTWGA